MKRTWVLLASLLLAALVALLLFPRSSVRSTQAERGPKTAVAATDPITALNWAETVSDPKSRERASWEAA